jgi:hypothetical protein
MVSPRNIYPLQRDLCCSIQNILDAICSEVWLNIFIVRLLNILSLVFRKKHWEPGGWTGLGQDLTLRIGLKIHSATKIISAKREGDPACILEGRIQCHEPLGTHHVLSILSKVMICISALALVAIYESFAEYCDHLWSSQCVVQNLSFTSSR